MKLYHDADEDDSWTEVTGIIEDPEIISYNNAYGICTVILRDFELSLFATWEPYDFIPMKITDDSANVLFRGYLIKKIFEAKVLILTIAGLGIALEWASFNANYIIAEGLVKQVDADDELHVYSDDNANGSFDAGEDYSWDVSEHAQGDRNRGVLILDNTTTTETETWNASAVSADGETDSGGDHTDTHTQEDPEIDAGDYYWFKDTGADPYDATAEFTMDGVVIPTSHTITKIEIDYNIAVEQLAVSGYSYAGAKIELYRDGVWTQLRTAGSITWDEGIGKFSGWVSGTVSIEYSGVDEYLTITGENYTALPLRIRLYGDSTRTGDPIDICFALIDYLSVRVFHNTLDISPISNTITGNNASSIICDGTTWTNTGVAVNDKFFIGENTSRILTEAVNNAGLSINIISTLTKYAARRFKGVNSLEVVNVICLLEGTEWCEDYKNNGIKIIAKDDFIDSEVDITSTTYEDEWQFEDKCNQIKKVEVFGNASLNVYAVAEDGDVKGNLCKQLIDNSINTNADAQEVADAQLALLKDKKPSIRLTVDGVQTALQLGYTIDITVEKPNGTDVVAKTAYPIRRIERRGRGIGGIKTTIYAGLGETPLEEELGKIIKNTYYLAKQNLSSKLTSTPWSQGALIGYGDIVGFGTGVRDVIDAEVVDGESIDNAIDTLIATHTAITDAHHAKYTDAEARGAINDIIGSDGHLDAELDADQHKVIDLPNCTADNDAARKKYVDDEISSAIADVVSDAVYDADNWNNVTDVAPSKNTVRDVVVTLAEAVVYKGTYTPGDAYPANPDAGDFYICDADGYKSAPGGGDNTPARWYEIGDWIVWNDTESQWDILRNSMGDNIIPVSPGDSIQAAIDEIESVGNGVVYLLPGTHTLTATLTANDVDVDLIIKGCGKASTIDVGDDRGCLDITNIHSLTVRDLFVDASDVTTTGESIIDVNETNDNKVIIDNIEIKCTNNKGLGIYARSGNITLHDCEVYGSYIGITMSNSPGSVCYANRCHDNTYGLGLAGNAQPCTIVFGNYIYDNNSSALNVGALDIGGDYYQVFGNYVYNNTLKAGWGGISIEAIGEYNYVHGNYIIDNSEWGIRCLGDNNLIGENFYYNNSNGNIYNSGDANSGGGRCVLGTYTGDGNASQLIYLEFRPMLILIVQEYGDYHWFKMDSDNYASADHALLMGLGAGNFDTKLEIDDAGFYAKGAGNGDLNKSGETYDYVVFG